MILEQQDEQRKAEFWQSAKQAATIPREQFDIQRMGVIGDLIGSQPLNYWSNIKLVIWEIDSRSDLDIYKALLVVSEEPENQLLNAAQDYLTVDEREAIAQALVEI